MELTEKQQIERIAKAVSHLAECSKPLHKCDVCKRIKSSVLSPDPELTPYQAYMAGAWSEIRPGSTEWIDMRRGWNAAVEELVKHIRPAGDCAELERSFLALKEPVV